MIERKKVTKEIEQEIKSERDDLADKIAVGALHVGSQGNQVNPEKVREIAYSVADALIAYRKKQ